MLEPYERDAIIRVAVTSIELEVRRRGYEGLYVEPYFIDGEPDLSGIVLYTPRGEELRDMSPIFDCAAAEVRNMCKEPQAEITYDISRDRTRHTFRAKR